MTVKEKTQFLAALTLADFWYSVLVAAEKLDLEENTLRRRLERAPKVETEFGTVSVLDEFAFGRKLAGRWLVFVPPPGLYATALGCKKS